jgi:hypothetical protein
MARDDSFSFDADELPDPSQADDPAKVAAVAEGTYRSSWSRLKNAAYSTTYCCIANTGNLLLPAAERICEKNHHPAERAFLLAFNHSRLVGGPALGAVSLVAFAQESFVRLAYQVALELRLQRSRTHRSRGLGQAIATNVAEFESQSFGERCRRLLAELRAPFPRGALQQAADLMTFRNSVAHDSPLLSLSTGQEQALVYGSPQARRTKIGPFNTLESETCPVRLRHVKAAIDAHDHLVDYCFQRATRARWADFMEGFSDGIGLRLKDAFNPEGWYKKLTELSRDWERDYQQLTVAPLGSFIEMRNAIQRRGTMRKL